MPTQGSRAKQAPGGADKTLSTPVPRAAAMGAHEGLLLVTPSRASRWGAAPACTFWQWSLLPPTVAPTVRVGLAEWRLRKGHW